MSPGALFVRRCGSLPAHEVASLRGRAFLVPSYLVGAQIQQPQGVSVGLHQQLAPPQAWGKGEAHDRLPDEVGVLDLPQDAVVFRPASSLPAAAPAPHHDDPRAVPAVEAAVLGVIDDRVHVALVHSLLGRAGAHGWLCVHVVCAFHGHARGRGSGFALVMGGKGSSVTSRRGHDEGISYMILRHARIT